jgi:hypothetical protein
MTDTPRDGPKTVEVCNGCRYLTRTCFDGAEGGNNWCEFDGRLTLIFHGNRGSPVPTPSWCPFLKAQEARP